MTIFPRDWEPPPCMHRQKAKQLLLLALKIFGGQSSHQSQRVVLQICYLIYQFKWQVGEYCVISPYRNYSNHLNSSDFPTAHRVISNHPQLNSSYFNKHTITISYLIYISYIRLLFLKWLYTCITYYWFFLFNYIDCEEENLSFYLSVGTSWILHLFMKKKLQPRKDIQHGTTAILSRVWDISNFSYAQA